MLQVYHCPDIKNSLSNNTVFVKPNQSIIVDNLKIKTLKSTDLGVAFIVKSENKLFYHAGDLNYWHWEGELTDEENYDQFLDEYQIKDLVKKYSDYVHYPIMLDDKTLNSMTPLWKKSKSCV